MEIHAPIEPCARKTWSGCSSSSDPSIPCSAPFVFFGALSPAFPCAGLSRWTVGAPPATHIKGGFILVYRDELVRALHSVVSIFSKGQIFGPIVSWITVASLAALKKKDGEHRFVAVGGTLSDQIRDLYLGARLCGGLGQAWRGTVTGATRTTALSCSVPRKSQHTESSVGEFQWTWRPSTSAMAAFASPTRPRRSSLKT